MLQGCHKDTVIMQDTDRHSAPVLKLVHNPGEEYNAHTTVTEALLAF